MTASEARRLAAWCRAREARGASIELNADAGPELALSGLVRYAGRTRGGRWDRYTCADGSVLEVSTLARSGRRAFRLGRGARRAEARR